jgi:biopolymer transport protein ExbD
MSEIQQGGGGDKGGKVRSKKASTRVDMTPMVDLGFLLITFFILATTLAKPKSMSVVVPDKQNDPNEKQSADIKAARVLTLFMGKDNQVFALDGIAADDAKAKTDMKTVGYGSALRELILTSKARINRDMPKDDKGRDPFICVIKPLNSSTYKNMVDVLDEMAVTKTKTYAMVDSQTPREKDLLGDKIK